ncbi:kinase-like domain-containing protein [Cadophora sp. MPI-SDFR-AT-0126]|nr:kinase-like domain-containing protein [Leotiomycetes sp. MPI-SDFR-AT-0126]
MESPTPDITTTAWLSSGVECIISCGCNNYIGLVDEDTVLKYPNLPPSKPSGLDARGERIYTLLRKQQTDGLAIEGQIFEILGQHPRFIGYKGMHTDGLLLEHAHNGSVSSYLEKNGLSLSTQNRLKWAMQATEGVIEMHKHGVLHCNIHTNNMLLDDNLDIKLCDFQGKVLNSDGTVRLDGLSCEDAKSSMPASDSNMATPKTDLFALGSAIYFMMEGHPPFEDLDSWKDEEEIVEKSRLRQFPALKEALVEEVVHKCWAGQYETAEEAERDLKKIKLS